MPSFAIGPDDPLPPEEGAPTPNSIQYPAHTITMRCGTTSKASGTVMAASSAGVIPSSYPSAPTSTREEVNQFLENTFLDVSRAMLKCSPDLLAVMSESTLDKSPTQRALTEIYLFLYAYFKDKCIEYNKYRVSAISSISAVKLVRNVLMTNLMCSGGANASGSLTNTSLCQTPPINQWYKTDHFPFLQKQNLQEQLSLQKIHELVNSTKTIVSSEGSQPSTFDQVIDMCYYLGRLEARDSRARLSSGDASVHQKASPYDMKEELEKLEKIKTMGYVNILHFVGIAFTLLHVPTSDAGGVYGLVKALLELTGVMVTAVDTTAGLIHQQKLPLSIALKVLHLWSLLDTSTTKDLLQELCKGVVGCVYNSEMPSSNNGKDPTNKEKEDLIHQRLREYLAEGEGVEIVRAMKMDERTRTLGIQKQRLKRGTSEVTHYSARNDISTIADNVGKMNDTGHIMDPVVVYHSPDDGAHRRSISPTNSFTDEVANPCPDFWAMLAS